MDTPYSILQPSTGNILLYLNKVDFRVVSVGEIMFFHYDDKNRAWSATVLGLPSVNENSTVTIMLRNRVTSTDILRLAPQLVQVHQRWIVNIDKVERVCDNRCHFKPPCHQLAPVPVSHHYLRQITMRFPAL